MSYRLNGIIRWRAALAGGRRS